MRFIIYNPNSKGGNFKYAQYTAEALCQLGHTTTLVLPQNALLPNSKHSFKVVKSLYSDESNSSTVPLKKLYFLYRVFFNPILFFLYLRKQPPSKIIFNDFDQLTALFWTNLFRILKKKHSFSVILHDPDRDAYPGGIRLSNWSMNAILKTMDVAFYHEQLPNKSYYKSFKGKSISIPHGIYPPSPADQTVSAELQQQKTEHYLLCIPGNIRMEKNYTLIIEALKQLPKCKLLIAGAPSSSAVNVESLRSLAQTLGVDQRIIWLVKYLTENEFTSVLENADLVLLYYKSSFSSQSGILNQIAPLKTNVLISDTASALTKLAKEFHLGTIAKADDKKHFIAAVKEAILATNYSEKWENYLDYASWETQAKRISEEL